MASLAEDIEVENLGMVQAVIQAAFGSAAVPAVPAALAIPTPAQGAQWTEDMDYSEKYCDDVFEYRRVTVPRTMLSVFPQGRCMEENEWRACGITMSRGWQHYDHHTPEANVLLFRRVRGTDPKTGQVPKDMLEKVQARETYIKELEQFRDKMKADQE